MFRKRKIITANQENKISCWDIAKQNFNLISESCKALEITMRALKKDSNLMKSCDKISIAKSDDVVSQTVQDLKNSIKTLKLCKINNRATREIIDQNPTINPPLRLAN